MKKQLIYGVVLACCCAIGYISLASATADPGPDEMILESTIDPAKTPRTAFFTHGAHQARMECGVCHHGADADGNRIDYTEELDIARCESCHNSSADMPQGLGTFKDAAHAQCIGCHRETDPALARCNVCHK
ncbi:cytochrome c3 family protein [Desulfobulbus alkaliphilus]|uniref:cytochrome c3 family protein n=1 Tax=Desulfobulbus alkaliphilus TaxID=869814 RepID=UPI001965FEDB|nr:cytochrome c3 family protein [Desulfobulbus alkaliphilus]MBM9535513.1 cytochrome c3 family protein [Desulfobulbus alkaliphilus]